eukprot:363783-Chlamydomonas_euryale.AAC.5
MGGTWVQMKPRTPHPPAAVKAHAGTFVDVDGPVDSIGIPFRHGCACCYGEGGGVRPLLTLLVLPPLPYTAAASTDACSAAAATTSNTATLPGVF